MLSLFYSVTTSSQEMEKKPTKLTRQVSASPNLYSYMANPKETFRRYVFGLHATTKRSLAEEAESGDDLSINTWLREGHDPNESDPIYGYTPLINACTVGRLTTVKNLVKGGADVNKLGPFGFSPLHAAAQNGHREIVAYLLRNGADINAQNNDDDTPMHLAIKAHRLEVIYQLISSGGNSRIAGHNQKDCIQCAQESGLEDVARTLKNYCAFNETHKLTAPLNHSTSVV